MLTLKDGPVAGTYLVKRAPLFLRAVIDAKTNEKDVLDALDDTPKDSEDVFVYQRIGEAGVVHLLMSPRSRSGFYAMAEYKLRDDIDGRLVRATESWRAWVASQVPEPVNLETGVIETDVQVERAEPKVPPRQNDPLLEEHGPRPWPFGRGK